MHIELNFTDNDIGFLTSFSVITAPHWSTILSQLEPVKNRSDEDFITLDKLGNKRLLSQIYGGFVEAVIVQKYLETQHAAETHLYYLDNTGEQIWYLATDVCSDLLKEP